MSETVGREALFMAKITRVVTHEIANILAAIGENALLVQDIISLSDGTPASREERIGRVFGVIDKQVTRGVEVVARLNSFAHTAYDVDGSSDLNKIVHGTLAIAGRPARLKKFDLAMKEYHVPLPVTGNPLIIEMTLFECLELIMEQAIQRTTVLLRPDEGNSGEVTVSFSSEDPSQADALSTKALVLLPQWTSLQESMARLDGRLEVRDAPIWFDAVLPRG